MLQPHRNKKFLRLKHLLSQLKNMPAPLMKIRLLMKKKVPGLTKLFQPLMKFPGQPLVLRVKNKPGQLKHRSLRLKTLNKPGKPHQLRLR